MLYFCAIRIYEGGQATYVFFMRRIKFPISCSQAIMGLSINAHFTRYIPHISEFKTRSIVIDITITVL